MVLRTLIRKRWQVTVPREFRQWLNLFQGQTLNWTLDPESGSMLIFTGTGPTKFDRAAFEEWTAKNTRKKKAQHGRRCGRKIRKSDKKHPQLSSTEFREKAAEIISSLREPQTKPG
jgi:bifunctional DNA-binding transcriptional regulator/antitoxin component of YhaV-PrlF toxin-antitoxin module